MIGKMDVIKSITEGGELAILEKGAAGIPVSSSWIHQSIKRMIPLSTYTPARAI
jgi:hypothetical protein